MMGLFVFLRRVVMVLVIIALIAPLVAHSLAVTVLHDMSALIFGTHGTHVPSVRISP